MDFHSQHNFHVKQEVVVKDEIDSEAHIKVECSNSQCQNESVLPVDCDRVKSEQVKLENVEIIDLTEDSVNYIKADELKIEKSEPKIEIRQDIEDYDSDATTDSDLVLERMMSEYVKMENQGETMKISEVVKIGDDYEEVKVKTEIGDTDVNVVSGEFEDLGVQQLTEEFNIKEEEVSESSSKTNMREERRYPFMICSSPDAEKLNRHGVVNRRSSEKSLSVLNFESGAYSDFTSLDDMKISAEMKNEPFYSGNNSENVQGGSGSSDSLVHLVRHFRQCHDSKTRVKNILHTCSRCDFMYKKQIWLDEHIIKNHPDSIASIARKVYECSNCTYKTVFLTRFTAHWQRNCRATSRSKSDKACMHCDSMFITKISLDDHLIKNHPDFIASVSCKIHECAKCPYRTTFSGSLAKHMQKHPEAVSGDKLNSCIHCGATFHIKRKLDNHILRKHPDFISSIASKMHHCANCTYKTITKSDLVRHISNTHVSEKRKRSVNHNSYICSQCHATCKRQIMLDEHIIENHPDSIASITRKIYACSKCSYKTVYLARFAAHSLNNCEDTKFKHCVHCNARFKIEGTLDDHIIRKHPEFMASVSAKVHKCTHCTYKTTNTTNLVSHMRTHPETVSNYNFRTCEHCNATFRMNRSLGEHILRKHPNFSASVSSKTHECTKCTYKTTMKNNLDAHMLKQHPDSIANISLKLHECARCPYKTTSKSAFDRHIQTHPESVPNPKLNTCMDCNAVYRDRKTLYEHILRNHPESVGSISYKIHECTSCTYKTTINKLFYNHMLSKHSNLSTTDFSKKYECTHCTYRTAYKDSLDQHMFKNHPNSFSSVSAKIYECTNCTYKTSVKRQFDNHVLRNHPNLFASDSSKIKECIYCNFKTTFQNSFNRHMRTHPENASSFEYSTCVHCNATFRSKEILDNHILNKHPDFMSSVTSTILECANCTYKTTNKKLLDNHLLRKHSDSIANVSSKIHECAHCTYKTAIKKSLVRHLQKHPETFSSSKRIRCVHCSATFEAKKTLDNHVLNKHPDYALSVSSKIYKCTNCAYNTTFKIRFDEHTLKNHPDSIASNTSKIHECTKCTYKTIMRAQMDRHISRKHPGTVYS